MGRVFLGDRDAAIPVTSILTFDALTLGYGRSPAAVRDLTTRIEAGALTALVGPNGAGKSTLLKAIAGVLEPLGGRVFLAGCGARDIAYLPQQSEIDRTFPLSVTELVATGLWREMGALRGFGRAARTRISRALSAVGLDGLERRSIGALSGGQMQRVLFARLLLQDARLILLDEPFAGVDAPTQAALLRVIAQWRAEQRTVLAVLHDEETVRAHFPQTMLLARELVAQGPTAEVLSATNKLVARQMCEACEASPHVCGRDAA